MASNLGLPEGFEVEYLPNEIPEGFEIEQQPAAQEEYDGPTISAYKPPTVLDNLKSAWQFVTEVPVAAFMEQKKDELEKFVFKWNKKITKLRN